jgi:hypothetical protein
MSQRANALADRLAAGAAALAEFASKLSDKQWKLPAPPDKRTVGVIVHHVGNMYPIEVQLAEALAAGTAITDVTWDAVHKINADHARDFAQVDKATALAFLRTNAAAAATAVRGFSDAQLDRAAPMSLYAGLPPVTAQFFIEDHAMRHSYHHLAKIRAAVDAAGGA